MAEKTRYSDEELQEFKEIILSLHSTRLSLMQLHLIALLTNQTLLSMSASV